MSRQQHNNHRFLVVRLLRRPTRPIMSLKASAQYRRSRPLPIPLQVLRTQVTRPHQGAPRQGLPLRPPRGADEREQGEQGRRRDVEGVFWRACSIPSLPFPSCRFDFPYCIPQSFAGIAKATPEQLRLLPGLGPTKVRRITEAVEKPFRPGSGGRSSLARDPTVGTQARDVDVDFELEMDLNGDDIDEFPDTLLDVDDAARASASRPRRPELEPDWNVRFADLAETEVQVHGTDEPTSTAKRKRGSSPLPLSIRRPAPRLLDDGGNGAVVPLGASEGKRRTRSRSRSPVWDIELDLNSD